MPTLPTNPHYIGDSSHVNDHNLIVTALSGAAYLSSGKIQNVSGSETYRFGKVLQVVANTSDPGETSATSSTFIDTGLSASITPTLSTSKILVLVFQAGCGKSGANTQMQLRLLRDSTTLSDFERYGARNDGTSANFVGTISTAYLDSPSTTSSITYKTQFNNSGNAGSTTVQVASGGVSAKSRLILIEVGP